jgi:probable phosphoglycerate mutase
MTRFLLVRHASHDWLGRGIAGRTPGVSLNSQGVREAARLPAFLAARPFDAIYSSPRERTLETAAPVANARALPVVVREGFDEIDFGEWTGRSFDEVARDGERWRLWCEHKGAAGAPGGETFAQVQERAQAALDELARLHPGGSVLVVTHGDVIKALLAGFLGLPLDHVERFEVAPASLSVADVKPGWSQVRLLNATAG